MDRAVNWEHNHWLSLHNGMAVAAQLAGRMGQAERVLGVLGRRALRHTPRSLSAYQPTNRDLFVTTFAKSGTNWSMQIGLQVARRGDVDFTHIHELVPWPEGPFAQIVPMDHPRVASPSTGWRVIKTHLPAGSVPYDEAAAYYTVIRDPKEVSVSAYYFMLGQFGMLDLVPPEDWLKLTLNHHTLPRLWAEHTASFWAWRDRPNVRVKLFSEMKADLPGAVDEVAELMGISLTESERASVLERSSFAWMKERDGAFAPPRSPSVPVEQHPNMMRKGKSTGGKGEFMDDAARAAMDAACREELAALGSDFPYDAAFGA